MLSTYQAGIPFPLPFLLSSWQIFRQTGQKRAKVNFSLVAVGVFSGYSETRRGEILIYFWKAREENGFKCGRLPAFWRVHLVQVVQAFEGAGPAGGWLRSSCRVFRCFCPLSRFALGAFPLKYAFIRVFGAFLARFMGFAWVCIACVPCVACGAFVCVRG